MGEKQIEKLRKGIEDYRRSAGRYRIDVAEEAARRIAAYLLAFAGIERVTPAGSLRRGRETAGDLDLLATGPACAPEHTGPAVEYVAAYPGIHDIIAKGENKVSFHLPTASRSTCACFPRPAMAPHCNTSPAPRPTTSPSASAPSRGATRCSEWALARLEDESFVAAATEEEIYAALGMDWIPPELRENLGEIEAAARHTPPPLIRKPTSAATSTCTPRHRRPQLHPRNGRSRARLRIRVHRHHRPLQESGHDQRPRREAGA